MDKKVTILLQQLSYTTPQTAKINNIFLLYHFRSHLRPRRVRTEPSLQAARAEKAKKPELKKKKNAASKKVSYRRECLYF